MVWKSGQRFSYKWSENLDNVSNINHTNSGQCFDHKWSENLDNVSTINGLKIWTMFQP